MESTRKGSDDIKNISMELTMEIENILKNTEGIAGATMQAQSATQEASAGVSEQSKGMEAIARTAEDIDALITRLSGASRYSTNEAEELATTAEELSATIEESNSATEQLSSTIDEISQTAEQQEAWTVKNVDLLTGAGTKSSEILEKATINREKMVSLQKLLSQIQTRSAEMIDKIEQSGSAAIESGKKAKDISAEVYSLERLISKLSSINTLTHVLAVTGRVESARAGEHGIGFATVSEDIRELVERSTDQIAVIEDGIRKIQNTILDISEDIEAAGRTIFQEIDSSRQSMNQLSRVADDIKQILAGIEEIETNGAESMTSIQQIQAGAESIATAAAQTSSSCEQSASTVRQQASAVSTLAAAAEEIAAQADELSN